MLYDANDLAVPEGKVKSPCNSVRDCFRLVFSRPSCNFFARLISHQPAVLFSQNKPATSNQPAVVFSQNKPAPAISPQLTEQAGSDKKYMCY
jgi:hypothetical protein